MIKYSVDKIKLYLYGIKSYRVQSLMDKFSVDNNIIAYESKKVTACHYNYKIKVLGTDAIVYVGIEPNWNFATSTYHRDFIIEYNPNKVKIEDVPQLKFLRFIKIEKIEIKSIDIAIDLDINITDLVVNKRHGNEYRATIGHSNLETLYLGAFGTSGHIRIYDKKKEQKIKEDINWTRFEITYKNLGFMDIASSEIIDDVKLPKIYLSDASAFDNLNGTEKYILLTSLENMELLNMLGRKMKAKIKEYHAEYLQELAISKERITETYRNFISTYTVSLETMNF